VHTPLSFLIDSNVVIAAEPFAGRLEELQPVISSFLRLAAQHGHRVYVHPATLDDLKETQDATHRTQNVAAYGKYPSLEEIDVPAHVSSVFPSPRCSNDDRDARILTALDAGAVHFLVTSDRKLRKRAIQLGHDFRVLGPGEAAQQLAAWHPDAPPPPPTVEEIKTYALDTSQEIFDALRSDYHPNFDGWISKVKKESTARRAWIVRDSDGVYEAIAIVKMSDAHPTKTGSSAIKLSTFKVADAGSGRRLGELLLKTVLRWAAKEPGRPPEMFVEVRATRERLLDFLEDFGFTMVTTKPGDPREQVWLKALEPPVGSCLDGFAHHKTFGPPALRAGQPIFVVPIIPKWYEDLFPDAETLSPTGAIPLPGTNPEPRAHGNAIRKAYLCRSPTKIVPQGSTLLFYRSQGRLAGDGAVVAVGAAEGSIKTTDPLVTIAESFKRTVYTEADVTALHGRGSAVLSILFRHDRFVEPPWRVDELIGHRVFARPPQSVMRVRDPEGVTWIEEQLNASR